MPQPCRRDDACNAQISTCLICFLKARNKYDKSLADRLSLRVEGGKIQGCYETLKLNPKKRSVRE